MPKIKIKKNPSRKPKNRVKEGSKRNYSCLKVATDITYMRAQSKILAHFGFKYSTLQDFISIYSNYTKYNLGINANGILADYDKSEGNFRALYFRLELLKEKGWIYNLDKRYYPTDAAITELRKLLKPA